MAENEKEQAAESTQPPEQEVPQSPEQTQEPAPEQKPEKKREKEKGEGLLMPILYALLAAIGGFTLVMFIWIGVAFFKGPAQDPSSQPSSYESGPVETQEAEASQEPTE